MDMQKKNAVRRCWGITLKGQRCKLEGTWRFLCGHHWPWFKKFFVSTVVLGSLAIVGNFASILSLLTTEETDPETKKQVEDIHRSVNRIDRHLNAIDGAADELERWQRIGQLVGGLRSTTEWAEYLAGSNSELRDLVDVLNGLLEDFNEDFRHEKLSREHDLRLRLAKATLANARGQYDQVLEQVTAAEANVAASEAQRVIETAVRANRVRGDAFFGLGQWRESIGCYGRIIQLRPGTLTAANSHVGRGNALYYHRKPAEAGKDFEIAIGIYQHLSLEEKTGETRGKLHNYLAGAHRNRGMALYDLGQLDASIKDYEKAIEIWTRLVSLEQRDEYLAMVYIDRGDALYDQGKLNASIQDHEKTIEIYTRLVDQEGRSELAVDLAESLISLAWLYATCHDDLFRNPEKAGRYATKACELTTWQDHNCLDALAAACASADEFDAAVKWQSRAIELAPEDVKDELQPMLELYEAGKPYREPPPKPE